MKTNQRFLLTVLKNVPIILFVVIFVAFSALDRRFFTWANFENIILSSAFVGVIAVGMTFVLLTGGIDLSVGAVMYITGATIALLLEQGVNIFIAILAGVIAGTLWGCLNAFLITRLKIIPFMVTLGTVTAGRGLGLLITQSRHISVPEEMRLAQRACSACCRSPL